MISGLGIIPGKGLTATAQGEDLMATYIEGDLQAAGKKFGIIVSRFNSFVSERLLEGALDTLIRSGAEDAAIDVVRVPGGKRTAFLPALPS